MVGEVYDWHKYKPVLKWIADQVTVGTDNSDYQNQLDNTFKLVLSHDYGWLSSHTTDFPKMFGMKSTDRF